MSGLNDSAIQISHPSNDPSENEGNFQFTNVFMNLRDDTPENNGVLIDIQGWTLDSENELEVDLIGWNLLSPYINPRLLQASGLNKFSVLTVNTNSIPVIASRDTNIVSISAFFSDGTNCTETTNKNGPGFYQGAFDLEYWQNCTLNRVEISNFGSGTDIRYMLNVI